MRRERIYGGALLLGTVAMLVTMAFHPTGRDLMSGRPGALFAIVATHVLAITGAAITFYGLLGLTRLLAPSSELPIMGIVSFGMATVAVITAAAASGLIAPGLVGHYQHADAAAKPAMTAVLTFNGHLNQAFAKIYVVASSVAIVLWSVALLRARTLGRGAAFVGLAVGIPTALAQLAGVLTLGVHGFGLVVLGQAIWMILVGVALLRRQDTP